MILACHYGAHYGAHGADLWGHDTMGTGPFWTGYSVLVIKIRLKKKEKVPALGAFSPAPALVCWRHGVLWIKHHYFNCQGL